MFIANNFFDHGEFFLIGDIFIKNLLRNKIDRINGTPFKTAMRFLNQIFV